MRPPVLRDWVIVRDSGKCLVLKKETDKNARYHLSKKTILQIMPEN